MLGEKESGNTAHRLDSKDVVLYTDQYNAWGSRLSGENDTDPFGYRAQYGYYTDHETGLILLSFRYDDPSCGRIRWDRVGYSAFFGCIIGGLSAAIPSVQAGEETVKRWLAINVLGFDVNYAENIVGSLLGVNCCE